MSLTPEYLSAIEARAKETPSAPMWDYIAKDKSNILALLTHIREQEKLSADMIVKLEAAQKQAEWLSKAHDELTDILRNERQASGARVVELEADINHIHEYIKENAPCQIEAWGKNVCACAAHRMKMQDLRIAELEAELDKDRLSQLLADALEERYKLNAEILAQAARITELETKTRYDTVFVRHIENHLQDGQYVICKICGKSYPQIIDEEASHDE